MELAGAIAEMACQVLVREFRTIDLRKTRTILVEAGPRILPSFDEGLSLKAEASLKRLSVEVRKNQPVTSIQPGTVVIGDQSIAAPRFSGPLAWRHHP